MMSLFATSKYVFGFRQGARWVLWLWRWLSLGMLWMLTLPMLSAHAALTVSGVISTDTVWRATQSPVLVQGDVTVESGAKLTVEAGVEIRMARQVNVTVSRGSLQMLGTAIAPIVVTSAADVPAPGDWGQWRMLPGTLAASTILEHVHLRYGSGMVIEGAAPVLNYVDVQQQSGPAISINLEASPIGRGLTAQGNALNAIAVPAGTIRSSVVWGLVGIPYLVQGGIVQVGAAPLSIEPAKLTLSPGVTAIVQLGLQTAAGTEGVAVDMVSSVPQVASVTSRVTFSVGQSVAALELQALAVGSTKITASHTELGKAVLQVNVVDLPTLRLSPGKATVGIQRPYAMTLKLPTAAPEGGVAVQLQSSDTQILTTPGNLLVPAGRDQVTFEVVGHSEGQAQVSAQAPEFATALAQVKVQSKALVLPSTLLFSPLQSLNVPLQLTEPAPEGGLLVTLDMDVAGMLSLPQNITVPAGTSNIQMAISSQSQLGTGTLRVSAPGYQSAAAVVNVDSISVLLEPAGAWTLNQEQSMTRRVRLSKAAPAGGVTLQATLADKTVARVNPSEFFVAENQIYSATPLEIKALESGNTQLTVAAEGLIGNTSNVNVAALGQLKLTVAGNRSKLVVGKKMYTSGAELAVARYINGAQSKSSQPLTVQLRCVDSSICSVATSITIAASSATSNIVVTGVNVGDTEIVASADGFADAVIPVSVVSPTLAFSSLDGTRPVSGARDDFYLRLSVPQSYGTQYAAQALTAKLSLVEQNPDGLVDAIYTASTAGSAASTTTFLAGTVSSSSSSYTRYVGSPSKPGTYRITAEIDGVASAQSAVQVVNAVTTSLKFGRSQSGSVLSVGKHMVTGTNELTISRYLNGVASKADQDLVVNLRCVDSTICYVPSTVTIPASSTSSNVSVTGRDLGETQIEAYAEGIDTALIAVQVIEPTVEFVSLDGARTPVNPRDDFYVRLKIPSSTTNTTPVAAKKLDVIFSIVEQSEEGVVEGIYDALTGGSQSFTSSIASGTQNNSTLALKRYIGQAAKTGSYRIQAQIADFQPALSAVQTVNAAVQSLQLRAYNNRSPLVVGQRMKNSVNELTLYRYINGKASTAGQNTVVSLRCLDEDVCTVAKSVTIPATSTSVQVEVSGTVIGETELEASSEGMATARLAIKTVEPTIGFYSLEGKRTTASARDNVYITLTVPDNNWSAIAAEPLLVRYTLTGQDPDGIVNGFYNKETGGVLSDTVTISKNSRSAPDIYIASPNQEGHYYVTAEIEGVARASSPKQTVVTPNNGLKFVVESSKASTVFLGRGMKDYEGQLQVQRTVNGVASTAATATKVFLRCISIEVCSVPESVTIPATSTNVTVRVSGVELGSTQIEATAIDFSAGYVTVETVTPKLAFYSSPASSININGTSALSIGAKVAQTVNTSYRQPVQPVEITLTSEVPSVASITSTVQWKAGNSYSNSATLKGLSAGKTSITASAPGFTPATSSTVTVAP